MIYDVTTTIIEKMYAYLIVVGPFLNLNRRCNANNTNVIRIGKSAGYIIKLSAKFPLSNSTADLCIPHPGQSNPISVLLGQGNK